MTESELNSIETALGLSLPEFYRQAAIDGLLTRVLNSNAQSVVAINGAFRNGEFGDTDWPAHLFAFGDDGAGNFYCLDVSGDSEEVLLRDHETLEIAAEADSFLQWIDVVEV